MKQENKTIIFLRQKRAGVLLPLFSIYSKESVGIGDFSDLKLAIDWVKRSGHSVLQLLPMNEMGCLPCPYDAISSFALEPVYIKIADVIKSSRVSNSLKKKIEDLRKDFPLDARYCDYRIREGKENLLRQIFESQFKKENKDFLTFKEENSYWLRDFCLFKTLKKYFKGLPWYDWPEEYRERNEVALRKFYQENINEIKFQEWTQWQLYLQFKEVKKYATEQGVFLKGDLPILVSRDSADVWAHREFFKLEFAAGAPVDMYCALGQRWGMPTYHWDNIRKDNFVYLKEKLRYAQNFYDLLRIDHVVGFFRIWSIPYNEPLENKGLNGFFDPSDERLWGKQGREILEVMQGATSMFLCAEDLGIIPEICRITLKELNIPGNDVQRWAKDWLQSHDFLDKKDYRFMAVNMLSTHDTTNFACWWETEAGTVDEELFKRKCNDQRNINFERVKDKLFDLTLSSCGRLRWKEEVDSLEKLLGILSPDGRLPAEYLKDFIELWQNSFAEKQKLWRLLGFKGKIAERCTSDLMREILRFILNSNCLFCINNIFDLLYLSASSKDKDNYCLYRINTPGTISEKNWSIRIPLSLEELLAHKVTEEIREIVLASGRI